MTQLDVTDAPVIPEFRTVRDLVVENPRMRPPIISGMLREGETMNVISAPKIGKSWIVGDLAITIAAGRPWFRRFAVEQGSVLILDNELHPETIAARLPTIAAARGIRESDYCDNLYVESLRGRQRDIFQMRPYFNAMQPGQFKVIVIDAMYRVLPRGMDENSNGDMRDVYNQIDVIADMLKCAFVLVHHSSKGSQAGKSIVDVGAGASAQARAADAHLILRQHDENGVVVADMANRSFPPPEPFCLRLEHPVWNIDPDLDPTQLREGGRRKRVDDEPKAEPWTPDRFARTFTSGKPQSRDAITIAAALERISTRQAETLFSVALEQGLITSQNHPVDARKRLYTLGETTR